MLLFLFLLSSLVECFPCLEKGDDDEVLAGWDVPS